MTSDSEVPKPQCHHCHEPIDMEDGDVLVTVEVPQIIMRQLEDSIERRATEPPIEGDEYDIPAWEMVWWWYEVRESDYLILYHDDCPHWFDEYYLWDHDIEADREVDIHYCPSCEVPYVPRATDECIRCGMDLSQEECGEGEQG